MKHNRYQEDENISGDDRLFGNTSTGDSANYTISGLQKYLANQNNEEITSLSFRYIPADNSQITDGLFLTNNYQSSEILFSEVTTIALSTKTIFGNNVSALFSSLTTASVDGTIKLTSDKDVSIYGTFKVTNVVQNEETVLALDFISGNGKIDYNTRFNFTTLALEKKDASSGVSVTIADNLITNVPTQALAASQGVSLKALIDNLTITLNGIKESKFFGHFATFALLDAEPKPTTTGWYATKGAAAEDSVMYIFDLDDNKWVENSGVIDAQNIKTLLFGLTDTHNLTDALLSKVNEVDNKQDKTQEQTLTPVAVGSPITHHTNTITSLNKENEYYVDLSTDVNLLEVNLPEVSESSYILIKAKVQGDPTSINRRIKFLSSFAYDSNNLTGSDSISTVGVPLAANSNALFFYLYKIIVSIDVISPTKKILSVSYQTTVNGINN